MIGNPHTHVSHERYGLLLAAVRIASLLLVCLAPPAIVTGTPRSLRARNHVTIEAVFDVLGLDILLGMFFATLYGAIYRLGGSLFASGVRATRGRCLYFSFTTLTTVGCGNLAAAEQFRPHALGERSVARQLDLVTAVG